MKLNKFFSALMLIGAVAFAACNTVPEPKGPGKNDSGDSTKTKEIVETPTNLDIPEGTLTVSQARDICAKLESGATTGTKYYVKGWVKKLHSKHTQETIDRFHNAQFYMSENQYSDGSYDTDDFMAYQVYYLDGAEFTSADQVQEGDYVVIYGELTNYNSTYETVGQGQAHIYSTNNPRGGSENPDQGEEPGDDPEPPVGEELSVQNLLDMKTNGTLPNKDAGTTKYWVKGYIVGVYDYNASQKFALTGTTSVNTSLLIADDPECADTYAVASVQLASGLYRDLLNLADNPQNYKKELKIYGIVEKYCGIAGVVKIEDAYLDGVKVEEPETTDKGATTVADFLQKKDKTGEYTLTGTVRNIGMDKNDDTKYNKYGNFDLEDSTGSIYVYGLLTADGQAQKFQEMGIDEGDQITLKGVYSEYQGEPQIKNAVYVSHVDVQ